MANVLENTNFPPRETVSKTRGGYDPIRSIVAIVKPALDKALSERPPGKYFPVFLTGWKMAHGGLIVRGNERSEGPREARSV